jgi:hypothetical protein
MKHKVSELEGVLLDAAVARAEGFDYWNPTPEREGWAPSRSWAVAGPIIERKRISIDAGDGDWTAHCPMAVKHGIASEDGPPPLIAAMRAYVASKFGEEFATP